MLTRFQKRSFDEYLSEHPTEPELHPLKKAKTEAFTSCGFALHFCPNYFVIPTILSSSDPLQHLQATRQTIPAPYWISDPRFLPGAPRELFPRTSPRHSSEEEVLSDEASDVNYGDDIVEATPIMAEVVDLPSLSLGNSSEGCLRSFSDIHPVMLRKLGASKSPIMEALVH
jgi:hypothetical protein